MLPSAFEKHKICSNRTKLLLIAKDTVKAFNDFKNKQQKVYEGMLFDMQQYVYFESIFKALYIEIKHKS